MKKIIMRYFPLFIFGVWFSILALLYPMSLFYRIISFLIILINLFWGYRYFRSRNYLCFRRGKIEVYQKQLTGMNSILTMINEEQNPEVILGYIVNEAFQLVPGAETYSFVIYNQQRGMFEFKAVRSKNDDYFTDLCLTPEEVESMFKGKTGPFIDNQVGKSNKRFRDDVRDKFDDYGVPEAMLFIPIWIEGQLQGYITLDNWTDQNGFNERDLYQIEQILPQLVLVYSKAQRKFELAEYKNKLEQLYLVGQQLATIDQADKMIPEVLKIIRNTLQYNDICIFLTQEDKLVFKGGYKYDGTYKAEAPDINLGEGVCGLVAKTGKPQIIPDISRSSIYISRSTAIASELTVPITAGKEILGVLNLESSRVNNFKREDKELMMTVASQLGIALSNLRNQNDLKKALLQIITALARSIETKDNVTGGHCERMEYYALQVGNKLQLTEKQMENLRRAAILHDIGKIGIPGNILEKSGKLTSEEFKIMQEHPTFGAKILREVDFLKEVAQIVEQHHERIDGTGYPLGLSGEEIKLEARIIAVVDAYDAMVSDRPYRKAFEQKKALQELERFCGTQFDSQIVEVFIQLLQRDSAPIGVENARRII